MKNKLSIRIISAIFALAIMVGSLPLTAFTAYADEAGTDEVTETAVKEPTPAEVIEKEMAERSPIVKDRTQIKATSKAAVYVDGKLVAEGGFSEMWNRAMELAPNISKNNTKAEIEKMATVEYVLNENFSYNKKSFSEKTMTVTGKKFTIDLNGFILSRSDEAGSVIKVLDYAVLTIMDSNPKQAHDGYLKKNDIWAWTSGLHGNKIIYGGVIAGGYYSTGDGGGLYIENHSTVYMTGGTLAGNKADVGSAAYLEEYSVLDMSRGTSQICYNYSAGTTSDGGAVFLRSNCKVIGGYIHSNLADDYGGGVRAKGTDILIKDVVVYNNRARDYGGGLYLERSGTEQTVTVSGCKIVGNYAPLGGGGVYVYDLYMTNMSDCSVENNTSDSNGAGISLNKTMRAPLNISGKMVVRDNMETTGNTSIKSNLYISANKQLIVGTLNLASEVWVKTGKGAESANGVTKPFVSEATAASRYYFFSDADGYYVEYQNDPSQVNYRYLYFAKGTRTDDSIKLLKDYSKALLSTPYVVKSGDYAGESVSLYRGYFEHDMNSSLEYFCAAPFYYSDGYFLEDPTVYNTHLATMSLNLAVSAFGRTTNAVGDNLYANNFANVKQLLADIGCADVNFYVNEDYKIKPEYYGYEDKLSTIGVAISQKEIEVNGESFTLVPVAVRGGNYSAEWASNLTLGNADECAGFADAANQVYSAVQYYVENYGLSEKVANGNVKFWVVGYSRGGAVANLTSKRIIDSYGAQGNITYGYTFEAPMGGTANSALKEPHTANGTYPTIHNTINENDFVTLLAPAEMGFMRYGVDHLIGADHNNGIDVSNNANSEYYIQKQKMLAQLSAINPYYNFNDYWEIADVNIVKGNIPLIGTDLIVKGEHSGDDPNKECKNIYDFLRWFFYHVQGDGFGLTQQIIPDPDDSTQKTIVFDTENSRESYYSNAPLSSIDGNKKTDNVNYTNSKYNFGYSDLTLQEATVNLVTLFMGQLSDAQMSELMGIISNGAASVKESLTAFRGWLLLVCQPAFFINFFIKIGDLYSLYSAAINNWDTNSDKKNAETINKLMHLILDKSFNGQTIWDVLTAEQSKIVAESLPVLIWFLLNYASNDYNTDVDDGMWGTGTFVNNMDSIISNHYHEVTLAWVRSYDDYYLKDLQSHRLDTASMTFKEPTGTYAMSTNQMTLSGESGSSIFYSVDDGETWTLYTSPVEFDVKPEKVLSFSIYRGVSSEVKEIDFNVWSGTILGGGNVWFLIISAAFIVALSVVVIEINRKKKKQNKK